MPRGKAGRIGHTNQRPIFGTKAGGFFSGRRLDNVEAAA